MSPGNARDWDSALGVQFRSGRTFGEFDGDFGGCLLGEDLRRNGRECAVFAGSGVFGAHAMAVDADCGAVQASAVGGWSYSDPGSVQFDRSYQIDRFRWDPDTRCMRSRWTELLLGSNRAGDGLVVSQCYEGCGLATVAWCVVPAANASFDGAGAAGIVAL